MACPRENSVTFPLEGNIQKVDTWGKYWRKKSDNKICGLFFQGSGKPLRPDMWPGIPAWWYLKGFCQRPQDVGDANYSCGTEMEPIQEREVCCLSFVCVCVCVHPHTIIFLLLSLPTLLGWKCILCAMLEVGDLLCDFNFTGSYS